MEAVSEACPVGQRPHLHWQQGDQVRERDGACQGMKTVGPPDAETLHVRWDGKGMVTDQDGASEALPWGKPQQRRGPVYHR
jgi:hypothetical protein